MRQLFGGIIWSHTYKRCDLGYYCACVCPGKYFYIKHAGEGLSCHLYPMHHWFCNPTGMVAEPCDINVGDRTRCFHSLLAHPPHRQFSCNQGCARYWPRLLKNSLNFHWSHELKMHCNLPQIHCRWGNPIIYLAQPVTQAGRPINWEPCRISHWQSHSHQAIWTVQQSMSSPVQAVIQGLVWMLWVNSDA